MGKTNGLGDRLFVGGYDMSGDVGSIQKIGGALTLLDRTPLNASAYGRIGGRRDGNIDFTAFFADEAGESHAVFSALPTGDKTAIYCRGTTLGNPGAGIVAKQVDYPLANPAGGDLTVPISLMANNYGVRWGHLLTAGLITDASASNGASIDLTDATTSFGLTAFLIVTALGSGTPTVKIQDSANDSTFADVTGATFGTVAALDNEIVQTSATATVRRYLRPVTTGTFTDLSYVIVVCRHLTATI